MPVAQLAFDSEAVSINQRSALAPEGSPLGRIAMPAWEAGSSASGLTWTIPLSASAQKMFSMSAPSLGALHRSRCVPVI